ncbi:MAG TPA: response regulator [Thermoanaerobaculia bacterium]|jgi:adenylate cyclase|nr:response regulator [Thermoanaerobaculia bacterium]
MPGSTDVFGARILIVDDQESNVRLLALALRRGGYVAVASTTDPIEVCALHQQNRYDLILLDLQMPRMNGFEVLEGLTNEAAVSVLVLSADPAHMARALAAGAKGFLSKPFVLAEVLSRVNLMLSCGLEDPEPLLTTEAFPWLRATV